jgi:hypothetical protein
MTHQAENHNSFQKQAIRFVNQIAVKVPMRASLALALVVCSGGLPSAIALAQTDATTVPTVETPAETTPAATTPTVETPAATTPAATTPAVSNFKDIQGNWAKDYIEALAAKGVIAGFKDGTFHPNEPVTRAQFAAIINKAFQPTAQRQAVKFGDVSSKFWANDSIQAAYRGGFLSGYPGQKFKPDQPLPKVQALVSLASGMNLRSDDKSSLSVYKDATSIPNYAVTAIAGATQKELVFNYPLLNQLNPNRDATRAEVAAFVYQALVNQNKAAAIPSDYLVKNPVSAQK